MHSPAVYTGTGILPALNEYLFRVKLIDLTLLIQSVILRKKKVIEVRAIMI